MGKSDIPTQDTTYIHVSKEIRFGANNRVRQHILTENIKNNHSYSRIMSPQVSTPPEEEIREI
jgi:hypothetical protein